MGDRAGGKQKKGEGRLHGGLSCWWPILLEMPLPERVRLAVSCDVVKYCRPSGTPNGSHNPKPVGRLLPSPGLPLRRLKSA